MAIKMASNYHATAIVYMSLNSITEELQIWEANGLGILAASLTKLSVMEFKSTDFRCLYGLVESVLDDKFLSVMQVSSSKFKLHHSLPAVIVGEANVIEMWRGKSKIVGFSIVVSNKRKMESNKSCTCACLLYSYKKNCDTQYLLLNIHLLWQTKDLKKGENLSKVQLFSFPRRLNFMLCTATTGRYTRNRTVFYVCSDWSIWIGLSVNNMTTQEFINM